MEQFDRLLYEISEEAAEQTPKVVENIHPTNGICQRMNEIFWLRFCFIMTAYGLNHIQTDYFLIDKLIFLLMPFIEIIGLLMVFRKKEWDSQYQKYGYRIAWGSMVITILWQLANWLLPEPEVPELQGIAWLAFESVLLSMECYLMFEMFGTMANGDGSRLELRRRLKKLLIAIWGIPLFLYLLEYEEMASFRRFFPLYFIVFFILISGESKVWKQLPEILEGGGYSLKLTLKEKEAGSMGTVMRETLRTLLLLLAFLLLMENQREQGEYQKQIDKWKGKFTSMGHVALSNDNDALMVQIESFDKFQSYIYQGRYPMEKDLIVMMDEVIALWELRIAQGETVHSDVEEEQQAEQATDPLEGILKADIQEYYEKVYHGVFEVQNYLGEWTRSNKDINDSYFEELADKIYKEMEIVHNYCAYAMEKMNSEADLPGQDKEAMP